ncbi:MAG: SDR family oxidoreductase [Symploca sp. SIO1C4]|uniref:SDR family oxidoreductase n=1 Tax=Symploca sp. SIO1C4 TaxID=2607765 RepID=A0A6B3NDH9_9CYAN|nr:SDR family oxidoreductase [Symploca sp. SIO1C4]
MKIAILGCGYVGKAVARQWTKSGHIVTATTTTPEKITDLEAIAQRVVVMKGDNLEALTDIVRNQDVVLFCVGAKASTVEGYQEAYLNTATNLVTALRNNPGVKQLIYTGNYALYGDKKGEWVDENTAIAPTSEYGRILAETEQLLLSANCSVCIFRLGGIYGAGREILKIFRPGAGTTRPGTGEDAANWIHLDDIVAALELARAKQLEGIYHLVNDVPLIKKQLLNSLCQKYNLPKISWDGDRNFLSPYNARLSNLKIKQAGLELIHRETAI